MTYENFIKETLVPAANASLKNFYTRYCDGADIGIESKSDYSPASLADRETEKILRDLIMEQYPDHGIWGEEFVAYHTDRDYVWVLDPLDGTKQFIDKRPGYFGCLIGLLKNGKAIAGVISDPINGKIFMSQDMSSRRRPGSSEAVKIDSGLRRNDSGVIACTHPIAMVTHEFLKRMEENNIIKKGMNCMAFVALLEERADVFVEHGLGIHDIVALIPVMSEAGMIVVDFNGNDYRDHVFDLATAQTQKYGIIAGWSKDIVNDILALKPEGLKS
jgi:fructose-1,6-bisphosphatase/inositol monophosphatase family enzyme